MGLLKHPPTSLRASYLTLGKVSCGAPPIDSMKLSKWDYVTDLRAFMDNLLIRNYIPGQIFLVTCQVLKRRGEEGQELY